MQGDGLSWITAVHKLAQDIETSNFFLWVVVPLSQLMAELWRSRVADTRNFQRRGFVSWMIWLMLICDGLAMERSPCNWSNSALMKLLIISPVSPRTFFLWASVSTNSASRKTWTWLASLTESVPSAQERLVRRSWPVQKAPYQTSCEFIYNSCAVVCVQWAEPLWRIMSLYPRQHLGTLYWMIHRSE